MAITYAAAGVLAGLSGAMLSAALQNPWVLGAFAAIFVVLAGAMFGFYELQLPSALQTRLAAATNRLHGGHFAGVFAMGALSAMIVGPCVAAPLAGALLYISQSRDVVLGGSALFAMALGMGVPLLVVGASAGALLPKAGPWMETVKRFFGVVLLGVAIYLVSPLLPAAAQMLAWAALLVVTGIYLRAIDPLPAGAHGFDRFAKGVGIMALVAGIAFLIGALSGARDILQPLAGLRGAAAAAPDARRSPLRACSSAAELDRAVAAARGRPVMLDFYADWCVSCKEMERYTFTDPQVQKRLGEMSSSCRPTSPPMPRAPGAAPAVPAFRPARHHFLRSRRPRDLRPARDRLPAGRALRRSARPGAQRSTVALAAARLVDRARRGRF